MFPEKVRVGWDEWCWHSQTPLIRILREGGGGGTESVCINGVPVLVVQILEKM